MALQGTGTKTDPYLIASVGDFELMREYAPTRNIYYIQTADLDFKDVPNYQPFELFSGVYDGQGFTIKNINCYLEGDSTYQHNAGLFRIVEGYSSSIPAIVRNLRLADCRFEGTKGASCLAGYVDFYSTISNITLERCTVISHGDYTGAGALIADIVAQTTASTTKDLKCSYITVKDCDISTTSQTGSYAGGVMGIHRSGYITNILVKNTKIHGYNIGGILGANEGAGTCSEGVIHDCELVASNYCGGVVGYVSAQTNRMIFANHYIFLEKLYRKASTSEYFGNLAGYLTEKYGTVNVKRNNCSALDTMYVEDIE